MVFVSFAVIHVNADTPSQSLGLVLCSRAPCRQRSGEERVLLVEFPLTGTIFISNLHNRRLVSHTFLFFCASYRLVFLSLPRCFSHLLPSQACPVLLSPSPSCSSPSSSLLSEPSPVCLLQMLSSISFRTHSLALATEVTVRQPARQGGKEERRAKKRGM